ncbi:hypothetical protein QZH41_011893, partial [Actinostola sp. cb2023]
RRYLIDEDGEPAYIYDSDILPGETIYTLKRCYYKNKSSNDLKKYIFSLSEYPKLCLVQCHFEKEEHAVQIECHGNNKNSNNPYQRTKMSVVERLRTSVKQNKPKEACYLVEEKAGGIINAEAISDLPRNREQASYLRRGMSSRTSDADSLVILLEQCKRQQLGNTKTAFVREVSCAPELRCVMAYDWQLDDIARFCTNPGKFAAFGADPTFNLGNFNITVTTYSNTLLVDRKTGRHPLMLGPLFMHQKKTYDAYNYFFSKLVSLKREVANILVFGTDGEEQLFKAMERNMYHALHLRCFGHFRDNCKDKLRALPQAVQQEFLLEIFGRRVDSTTMQVGLLDAKTESDFDVQLESLKDIWNDREKSNLPSGKKATFHDYMLSKADMIRENMLQPVRINAGLGNPPQPYYNNIPESANMVIKRGVDFKTSEMSEFCQKMEKVLQQARRDCESAVINRGPYKLLDEYQHLEVAQDKWFSQNARQRENYLKKFWNSPPVGDNVDVAAVSLASETTTTSNVSEKPLSVAPEESGVTGVALLSLKEMFKQAERLLQKESSMSELPFIGNAFMVESTNNKPHYVVHESGNGKTTCDDCPRYKASKICPHALAVAEKCGALKEYLRWFKRSSHTFTITDFVTCDSSKGVGRKGERAATSRRKGGRSLCPPQVSVCYGCSSL